MKLLVILEAVFLQTPDGRVWSSGIFTPAFFNRYLATFSHLTIAARIRPVATVPPDYPVIDDPRITFAVLPWYKGLLGYLLKCRSVTTALRQALTQAEAVILRVPSPLAGRIQRWIDAIGRPFAVEVVGDPWDVFAPGVIHHPFRPLLRYQLRAEMRHQCQRCVTAAYVTAHTLQQRYPTSRSVPSFAFSSIELSDDAFVSAPRHYTENAKHLRIILVATMSQRYKGQDVLLRAVARCRDQHQLSLRVTLIGDGIERTRLEQLCQQLKIGNLVRFTGHVADRKNIQQELDLADAFVLPSRTEGLPRALIEAMARGLPCLGTPVGGIPELLDQDALFPVDDHQALAEAIATRLHDCSWKTVSSARNLAIARNYHRTLLYDRCQEFYRTLQAATAPWLEKQQQSTNSPVSTPSST